MVDWSRGMAPYAFTLLFYLIFCICSLPDTWAPIDIGIYGRNGLHTFVSTVTRVVYTFVGFSLSDWVTLFFGLTIVFYIAQDVHEHVLWYYHNYIGGYCWRSAIDCPELTGALNRCLPRDEFLEYVAARPTRDWLAGRIFVDAEGKTYKILKFDPRSHRRIHFGRSCVAPEAKFVHVDVNTVINVATAANASTMGLNEANARFKTKTASTLRVQMNMTSKQEKELRELAPDIPFDITGGKNVTNDHAVLAGGRMLIRQMFESLYQVTTSNLPTLVVGSASGDLHTYEINKNVDHYFAGVESKDYLRTVVPLLERFAKKTFDNRKGCAVNLAKDTYRCVLKTVKELLHHLKQQEGWKMGLFTKVEELQARYERLVLRDIYELGAEGTVDLFRRTGANHAVGYGIYPDELVFDNLAPDKHYRYDYNGSTERSTLTYRNGYCNGYSHRKSVWGWFLKDPVLVTPDFTLVTEIVARVGPYAIYSITRHNGPPDYVPRTIGLPRRKHRALIADLPAVFKGADVNDTRFAVNVDEWQAVYNWAKSLDPKALNAHVIMTYIRRMIGGVSLVNKELVEPWTLRPADAARLALAVLVEVSRTNRVDDRVLEEALGFESFNLLKATFRKPVGILDGIVKFIRRNGLSSEVAVYPDNEFFVLDQTPLVRSDDSSRNFKVNIDCEPHDKIGCDFCSAVGPKLGKQVLKCTNSTAPGIVDTSMTDDELRGIRNELQDDDNLPTGLAKLYQDVKNNVPTKGFANRTKFSYILGGPGAGKSHLIRSIAKDEDSIYVPFMKLKVDYEQVPDPDNPTRNRDLRFATTHRGLKLGLCKRLFIDEFTALDWRLVKLVIHLTCPDEVFIVGDTLQTGIRTGVEGVNIQDVVDIDALPRHQLMYNFRNGRDTVHWMNRRYDYGFGSYRPANESPSLVSVSPRDVLGAPGDASELFFTHATAAEHGRSQRDAEKYTVRSHQGSTLDNAIVYLTEKDLNTASIHGMLLVALTRARRCTYIKHDGSQAVVAFLTENCLPVSGAYQYDETEIPVPVQSFAVEQTVPEPAFHAFCRNVKANEDAQVPEVVRKEWFSISSYQIVVGFAWLLYPISPFASIMALLFAINDVEPTLSYHNSFAIAKSVFLANYIGYLHQLAVSTLYVFAPNSKIYWWIRNNMSEQYEVRMVRYFFGEVLGQHIGSVQVWTDTLIRRFEAMTAAYPVVSRIGLSLPVMRARAVGPIFQLMDNLPTRLGIVATIPYVLLCSFWILWFRRGARPVVSIGTDSSVTTASFSGSFFRTTLSLRFGDTIKAHTLDYLRSQPKDTTIGRIYGLLSGTWMPEFITAIRYVAEEDLEAQIPDGLRVTPKDAFRTADIFMGSSSFVDPDQVLTNAEQVMIPNAVRNGTSVNKDDFLVPLDRKARLEKVRDYFRFSSGYGYHFSRASVAQSIKGIVSRYVNTNKAPSKTPAPDAIRVAREIVDYAMAEMFQPLGEVSHREDLMEIAINEAADKASSMSYETQISIDSFDAHKVRMFMKETFKPGPLSSLKPFNPDKAGMGVSPFDKSAHVTFFTVMRYLNLLVLDSLRPNVIYDNRLTEDRLQEKVNDQLRKLPPTCVNGVTDFKMYDSQQDAFCQLLLKELCMRFGVSGDMLDHFFSFCHGSTILADGGFKGKLGHEKLSGDPATLLFNSMLGGMITNYLFRGVGPSVLLIKGDDGFKRQLGLRPNPLHAANLSNSTRLQAVMCEEEPAEFCGKIVGSVMCDNIYRKLTALLSRNFVDYTHYAQYAESLRQWVNRVETMEEKDYEEFIAQNAQLMIESETAAVDGAPAPGVATVLSALEVLKSMSHLSESQFYETFPKRQNPVLIPASGINALGQLTAVPTIAGNPVRDLPLTHLRSVPRRINAKAGPSGTKHTSVAPVLGPNPDLHVTPGFATRTSQPKRQLTQSVAMIRAVEDPSWAT